VAVAMCCGRLWPQWMSNWVHSAIGMIILGIYIIHMYIYVYIYMHLYIIFLQKCTNVGSVHCRSHVSCQAWRSVHQ
jgi:hypothetical protein